jgi:hypothetical protein
MFGHTALFHRICEVYSFVRPTLQLGGIDLFRKLFHSSAILSQFALSAGVVADNHPHSDDNAQLNPSFLRLQPELDPPADGHGLGPQLVARNICPIAKCGTPDRNRA